MSKKEDQENNEAQADIEQCNSAAAIVRPRIACPDSVTGFGECTRVTCRRVHALAGTRGTDELACCS